MFLIDPRRQAEVGERRPRQPSGWRSILPPLAGLVIFAILITVAVLGVTALTAVFNAYQF